MKKLKQLKKLIISLFTYKGKRLSLRAEQIYQNKVKRFFEGSDLYDTDPIIELNINLLGITAFEVREFKTKRKFIITLKRPGLLIGKGDETITKLKEYLSNGKTAEIHIIESKLWI
jgi:ribosomal protein S3